MTRTPSRPRHGVGRSSILGCELLEDRIAPAQLRADLAAARSNQAALHDLEAQGVGGPQAALVAPLAQSDLAVEHRILVGVNSRLSAIHTVMHDGFAGSIPNLGARLDHLHQFRADAKAALTLDHDLLAQFGTNSQAGSSQSGSSGSSSSAADPLLVSLQLNALDVNLLGLEVKTDPITVNVSAQPGSGQLLGNVLTAAANLINLQGVNNALNNVLGSVVGLLNSASLGVSGVGSGSLSNGTAATVPVLDAYVAPVHLNLLGAVVDTSPIHLTITAHSGQGLVLGNVVADLANLFNPPLPKKLDLNVINNKLEQLLSQLNAQVPGIAPAPTPATPTGSGQLLSLIVPPINLNLAGLVLTTSPIQVNASAATGNGDLLGNVLTSLLNTLGATPDQLNRLNGDINALLAKVVGILNASNLTLAPNALGSLSPVLQLLANPTLVTSTTPASTPVLNLAIASTDGTTPPVDVNLLGLTITTSNIQAQLAATTGNGQLLGNLVYNVSHLLDPGGTLNLLTILGQLGL